MFIAAESTEKSQNDSDLALNSEVEREMGANTEAPVSPIESSTSTSEESKNKKKKRCQRPRWNKFPFYRQKFLGFDSLETVPRRCHKHTIIFLHTFNRHGKQFAKFSKRVARMSKHARIVAPSAPLRTIKELKHWLKWFHMKRKWHKLHHSWAIPDGIRKSLTDSVRWLWDLIDREAKLLKGDYKKIYLFGHGQGAHMAIQTGVSFNKTLGGIVAAKNWAWGNAALGINQANDKTPIFTILGKKDQVNKLENVKARMNDSFWQSNKKDHVKLRV